MYNYSQIHNAYQDNDWETILPKSLNYNFIEIPNLGITQNIAVWNQMDKI